MTTGLTHPAKVLLAAQQDVIAFWQLGPSDSRAARRAVKTGSWRSLTSRTALASRRSPDEAVRAWAAVLHCGNRGMLGGRNALVLHRWRGELGPPYDVVVPPTTQPPKPPEWVRVRRLTTHKETGTSPPRVPVHDAVLQAVAWARSDREAIYVLVSAMQQRLTTPGRLLATLRPTSARRSLITAIANEYERGIQSVNEYDFGRLCRRFGLPQPKRQTLIRDAQGRGRSIDVEFDVNGRGLRVEIEGVHHLNPDTWLEDIDRHNDIVLAGESPYLRVASLTLRLDPAPFMARLGGIL